MCCLHTVRAGGSSRKANWLFSGAKQTHKHEFSVCATRVACLCRYSVGFSCRSLEAYTHCSWSPWCCARSVHVGARRRGRHAWKTRRCTTGWRRATGRPCFCGSTSVTTGHVTPSLTSWFPQAGSMLQAMSRIRFIPSMCCAAPLVLRLMLRVLGTWSSLISLDCRWAVKQ